MHYNGNPSSAQGERLMAFQAILRTVSHCAPGFCSKLQYNEEYWQLDEDQMADKSCIVDRIIDEAALSLKHFIECHFIMDSDTIAFSGSIDATKVPPIIVPNYRKGVIVGGAHPNHFISLLENDGDARLNKEMKFASEVKNGTVSFQTMRKPGLNPYLQLMAQPQTKNESFNFNDDFWQLLRKLKLY
jgi:hypothetical protein